MSANLSLLFTNKQEVVVQHRNFHLTGVLGMLTYQGRQILHLALFIPYFLTSSHINSEAIFIAISCVALLHFTLIGFGLDAARHATYFVVGVKRFKVILVWKCKNCIFNLYM